MHVCCLTQHIYIGYASGEAPLPNKPATSTVKDFGALGDGVTDDTQAFIRAIRGGGVIFIPPGRLSIVLLLPHEDEGSIVLDCVSILPYVVIATGIC